MTGIGANLAFGVNLAFFISQCNDLLRNQLKKNHLEITFACLIKANHFQFSDQYFFPFCPREDNVISNLSIPVYSWS